ncbi:RSP_7527 family protein [Anianabacter salinae]|uniref:RSP_7527 family protein n=1 Tax=Anianabacter salinae TaxID=2851023 RepID=UPI00225E0BEF|nr:hypothetical protein [Anianabacter salinae]MBV0911589.1 hypothetical protein [Anianabacter salinae]
MNREDHIVYDIIAIEREARRMRAEATRHAVQSMIAWFRGKRDAAATTRAQNV